VILADVLPPAKFVMRRSAPSRCERSRSASNVSLDSADMFTSLRCDNFAHQRGSLIELERLGADDSLTLNVRHLVAERLPPPTDLLGVEVFTLVAGSRRQAEAGVDDAPLLVDRRSAHVQRAAAVHGHVTGAGGQRHAREI